jgi:TrmH family RNA methyltransferase
MQVRVVLVEPEHDLNVGHCCRAMKNFGFSELVIVNAKCELGFDANMYAKHGADVLKNARKTKKINEAVRDCSLVVGTTGIERRNSGIIRNPVYLPAFAKQVAAKKGRLALLMGREGMGLTPAEIGMCDFLVTIPADGRYPVLNLSHALAVILYSLREAGRKRSKETAEQLASHGERRALLAAFVKLTKNAKVRQPEKIANAFKNVVERSQVSSLEARAILAALKGKSN